MLSIPDLTRLEEFLEREDFISMLRIKIKSTLLLKEGHWVLVNAQQQQNEDDTLLHFSYKSHGGDKIYVKDVTSFHAPTTWPTPGYVNHRGKLYKLSYNSRKSYSVGIPINLVQLCIMQGGLLMEVEDTAEILRFFNMHNPKGVPSVNYPPLSGAEGVIKGGKRKEVALSPLFYLSATPYSNELVIITEGLEVAIVTNGKIVPPAGTSKILINKLKQLGEVLCLG